MVECPALAWGDLGVSILLGDTTSIAVHWLVSGSYTVKSSYQRAECPDPPNNKSLSFKFVRDIPALGLGMAPSTIISVQDKVAVFNANKSLSLLVPSQPPKIYKFDLMIEEEWLAL